MKKKGLSLILAGILVASAVLNPFSHNTVKAYAEESNNPRVVSEETQANKNYLYLSDIEYVANKSSVGYSSIKLDKNIDNGVIKLIKNGEVINFAKGVGAHAKSTLVYDIGKYSKDYTKFTANIGVDYSMRGRGNGVTFKISTSENGTYWKDVKTTGVITAKNESVLVDINIEGVKYLRLIAETNGGNEADHSVYADARLLKKGYNLNDDLYQGIKTLSQYDEEIKKVNLESNLSSSKEILQKRELVRRLGYETLQSNLRDNNKVKDTFDWLLNDKEALELFIEAGDISESGRFINVLSNLYDKYKDCLSDEVNGTIYKKMMIALATGWSSDSGTSALDFNMNLPTFDAVGRFQIMKDFYDKDKLARKEEFKTYNMELMRMIMNNQMANEDLIWLNNYANKKYPNDLGKKLNFWNYGIAYRTINLNQDFIYNESNREKFDTKYSLSENNISYGQKGKHNLWMLFEVGGVCWNSSRFGQNLNKAFGLPSIGIYQPWHEAVLEYTQDSQGRGVWSINNNIGGWQKARTVWGANKPYRTLLDWGNKYFSDKASDSAYNGAYMLLGQSALDNANYEKSYYYNLQANSYSNPEDKINAYNKSLEALNINLDSFEGLINEYKKANKSSAEWRALAEKVINAYTYYPYAMVDLLKVIRPNLSSDDRADIDIARADALNVAARATKNDVFQDAACRDIAKTIMGRNKVDLASFSFNGDNANKIVINNSYGSFSVPVEYSLDGGNKWVTTEAGTSSIQLSDAQVKSINVNDDIKVRLVGSSYVFTIDIKKASTPDTKTLTRNNETKRLEGKTANLEYSLDDGKTWQDYTNDTVFKENEVIKVRYKSNGVFLFSDSIGYTFLSNSDRIAIIQVTGYLDAVVSEALKGVDVSQINEILVSNNSLGEFSGNEVEKSIVAKIKEFVPEELAGDYSIYINNYDKSAKTSEDISKKKLVISYKLNDNTPVYILENGKVDNLN